MHILVLQREWYPAAGCFLQQDITYTQCTLTPTKKTPKNKTKKTSILENGGGTLDHRLYFVKDVLASVVKSSGPTIVGEI